MRPACLLAVAALVVAGCDEQTLERDAEMQVEAADPASVEEIEAVMEDSAAGWNAGDIDRFMAIYSADPDTTFVGSGGLMRGVEELQSRYQEAYDWTTQDPSARGELSFETLDFRPLGTDHVLYIGQYTLTYPGGREPASGPTSLVFARENEGWKVVADHSS